MAVKFHEKNQAVYFGLQTASGVTNKIPSGTGTLSTVVITGTAGQFSCAASILYLGMSVTISGTLGGTGTITGYTNPTTYYIVATNGSTTFTLSTTKGGTGVVTTTGTPTGLTYTWASLRSDEAIACTAVTADPTRETGSFAFLGDSLSRDEFTYEKDTYIDLKVETFQQILSDMATAIDPNTNSIWKLFQVCGGFCTVNASTKEVVVGNNIESPDYGTADVRLASPDDATNDKLYKFWDLRGTFDVDASVGEVPTLKFSLKGNSDTPVAAVKQTASTGFQTTRVASSVLPSTIQTAQLALLDDVYTNALGTISSVTYTADGKAVATASAPHGLTIGNVVAVTVTGLTPASLNGTFVALVLSTTTVAYWVKNLTSSGTATGTATMKKGDTVPYTFCFSTLAAPNFFGYDLTRYQTGCDTGFTKGAVPTDVSVSMLEDQVGASGVFNPDANLTKFYAGLLRFGKGTAGTNVALMWDKLQVANVKQGKVATYLGRDVTFRNTGQSFILYS